MREYKLQIMRTCIQTYFNLYGIMPGTQELREMLGESFDDVIPSQPINAEVSKAAA